MSYSTRNYKHIHSPPRKTLFMIIKQIITVYIVFKIKVILDKHHP